VEPENVSDFDLIKADEKYNNNFKIYQAHLNNKSIILYEDLLSLKDLFINIIKKYGSYQKLKDLEQLYYISKPSISLDQLNIKINKLESDILEISNNLKISFIFNKSEKMVFYDNKISDIKHNITSVNDDLMKYNEIKDSYMEILKNNVKKPNIDLKELNDFILSYKKVIKTKSTVIEKLQYFNKIKELKKNIDELDEYINNYKCPDYNDNCWACRKQVWKIELDNKKILRDQLQNEYNEYKISKTFNKQVSNYEEKLKYIEDNEIKYNNYINIKNDWELYNIWFENITKIKNKLDEFDITKKDRLYEELELLYKMKELKEYYNFKEDWNKYTKYLEIYEILKKVPEYYKNKDIINIEKDIEWYDVKKSLEKNNEIYKNELDTLKSKKYLWNYNKIMEKINRLNLNDKVIYWNNILNVKPNIELKKKLEEKINKLNDKIQNELMEYNKNKNIYDEYNKKNNELNIYINFINRLDNKLEILENIIIKFSNYRSWLYKEKIIPKILKITNDIISNINNEIQLDADVDSDTCTINWFIKDGTNIPIIQKASGFQKFILSIAIRISLSNLSGIKCQQIFIDEGFVACDSNHLSKVPNFLFNLLNIYNNVILVSHLESIKELNIVQINIKRKNDLSKVQFGNKL
jgi:DNA repair exonuclease SbcCD ATPase subunit